MSNKIKIWGRFSSGNVKKVLVTADELSIPYQRVEAGGKFGVVDTPEYRRLNPNGRVPTIEDGGYVLWESNAIIRYLANKYGGDSIYPQAADARGLVDRWLDWQLGTLVPADVPVFMGTVRTPPEKHDKAAIAQNSKPLFALWAILEAELNDKQYLVGDRYSLADLALAIFAHRIIANSFLEVPDMPNVGAWYDRVRARPAFKPHVDVPLE